MSLEIKMRKLHGKAQHLAFAFYIRKGFVPPELAAIIAATTSLPDLRKSNPNHDPANGQFTSGPGSGIDDPPIEPVYPLESLILDFLPPGRLLDAWRAFAAARAVVGSDAGDAATAATADGDSTSDASWELGTFKNGEQWGNRITDGYWTPKDINDLIQTGESYPVENRVNPSNPARQYYNPDTGRFIVLDEVTKQILQLSRKGFNLNPQLNE